MAENPLIDYDWTFADFTGRMKTLGGQGLRLRSLSMYGNPAQPRFAAVWRTASTPWRWYLGYTRTDFASAVASCAADGLFPTLVAVTGGGTAARYSGTFEPLPAATELTLDQSLEQFGAEVVTRADTGWLPRSVAIHDNATGPTGVTAVWERNTANVAWNAFAGHGLAEQQTLFDVMYSGWARPVIMGASTQGRQLAVYRDDQVAGIGQGFAARGELTIKTFLNEQKAVLAKGMWTASLQGYGPPGGHRYTAIFVASDQPAPRTQRITGSPAVSAIDQAVLSLMKQSNIRGASLAIARDTRLVLARGYTWAEPDYPTVQPTTPFRLASGSKLLAEGAVSGEDLLPAVLPLDPPPGGTTSALFSQSKVKDLLDNQCQLNPDYEGRDAEIAALFGSTPPAKLDHIARSISANPTPPGKAGPNDGGFFLAGELVRRSRGLATLTQAIDARISKPLHITRLRSARTLITDQPADEARHHPRWPSPVRSVMSAAQPTVLGGYGEFNIETMTASGGLSAAAPDLVRVLAAMNARPYTPLGRTAVDSLLASARAGNGGHGFDGLTVTNQAEGLYQAWKGGLLNVGQSGIYFENGRFCYVILWNSNHTGTGLRKLDQAIGGQRYGRFHAVVDAAAAHRWPAVDRFPAYGMPSLPQTESGWQRCNNCAGLFRAATGAGVCPNGGAHASLSRGEYLLMRASALGYGQSGWRWCVRCGGLFFAGTSKGACPAGGVHQTARGAGYSLVHNSPYREHQKNWRWCSRCQGLWYAGRLRLAGADAGGRCPAGGGHTRAASGNYALATSAAR